MSDKPKRNPNGTFHKGQTGNPGGKPKWLGEVQRALKGGSLEAAQYLASVVRGDATEPYVTKDGETLASPVRAKDRIAAAKVVLEFTVPKPQNRDEKDAATATRVLAQWTREELLIAARNPPTPPEPTEH